MGIATGNPIQNFDPSQQAVERRFLRSCKTWSYIRAYSHIDLALYSLERFSLDCRIGIGFGFGFGFTKSFGWLVYLLWFWFYDSQVKTAL